MYKEYFEFIFLFHPQNRNSRLPFLFTISHTPSMQADKKINGHLTHFIVQYLDLWTILMIIRNYCMYHTIHGTLAPKIVHKWWKCHMKACPDLYRLVVCCVYWTALDSCSCEKLVPLTVQKDNKMENGIFLRVVDFNRQSKLINSNWKFEYIWHSENLFRVCLRTLFTSIVVVLRMVQFASTLDLYLTPLFLVTFQKKSLQWRLSHH